MRTLASQAFPRAVPKRIGPCLMVLVALASASAAGEPPRIGTGERLQLAPSLAVTLVSLGEMSGCASQPECDLKFVDAIVQVDIDGARSSVRVSTLGAPPLGIEVANGDHRVTVDDVIVGGDGVVRLQLGMEEVARPQLDDWTRMRRQGGIAPVSYSRIDSATLRTLASGQQYQVLDSLFPGGFADGDWLMVRCLTYDLAGERVDVHKFCDGIPHRDRLENLPEPMRGLLRAVDGGSEYRFLLTRGDGVTPKRPLVLELAVLNQFRE